MSQYKGLMKNDSSQENGDSSFEQSSLMFLLSFSMFWLLSSNRLCKAFLVKVCRSGLFMNSLVWFHLKSNSFVMRRMKRFLMLCWLRPWKLPANLAHFFGWTDAFSRRQMSSSTVQSFLLNSCFSGRN